MALPSLTYDGSMLNSLQACRAFAALAVVVFHLSATFGKKEFGGVGLWEEYTALGYLGVDFFFALSGFILLAAHHADLGCPGRLRDYLVKRFIRIYPFYWITTGVVLGGAWLTNGASMPPASLTDTASMVSLVHLNSFRPPVAPAWTLFHEIFFYALVALAVWNRRVGFAAVAAWALVLVIANGMAPGMRHPANAFIQMLVFPGNLAFFGGFGAYLIYRSAGRIQAAILSFSGVFALIALLMLAESNDNILLFKAALSLAFAGMIGGIAALEKGGLAFDIKILTAIGNASFMLYLTHENIMSWSMKLIYRAMPAHAARHPMLVYLAVVLVCVLFSLVAHRWLEKPLLRSLRKKLLPLRAGQSRKIKPGFSN